MKYRIGFLGDPMTYEHVLGKERNWLLSKIGSNMGNLWKGALHLKRFLSKPSER